MSDKPLSTWGRITTWFRFWLADQANRICRPEGLYWSDPERWDHYINQTGEYAVGFWDEALDDA